MKPGIDKRPPCIRSRPSLASSDVYGNVYCGIERLEDIELDLPDTEGSQEAAGKFSFESLPTGSGQSDSPRSFLYDFSNVRKSVP